MSPDPPKRGCHGSDDDDCISPPSSDGNRHLVTPLVVTAFALVFLALASLSIYCFVRRRRRRRRQQSLLAAEAANSGVQGNGPAPEMAGAATATDVQGGAPDPEEEEEEVVHHAWHIRTVGLDEAAIESIALTRYRAGAGALGGAADCSVCLGEFLDGELLRLLPKCGHAFHVPCIDTWLRAHVNCPLCRADVVVLHSAATADSDSPADDAQQVPSGTETLNHERPGPARRQNEQQDLRVQIDRRNLSRSPEPPQRRMQSFRRVASMDSSVVSAGARLQVPQDKRSSTENQGNGDAANGELPSGSGRLRHVSGGGRWSLLSRHRRTSSSLLPS